MPSIGWMHPQVVHFVVASLILGLPIYWLSLLTKPRVLRPMAIVLLIVGTGASWVAVKSGLDAHELAERIPGARPVVSHHEDLGILTRNIFTGVLILEMIALTLAWRSRDRGDGASTRRFTVTALSGAVAVAWTVGAFQLFETAEHGGEIVYQYAGGVGFRTGDTADVDRLLLAGLYGQSRVAREAGRSDEAAGLVEEMVRRYPGDTEIQLLGVESLIIDRKAGRDALTRLAALDLPDDPRTRLRKATYTFDAYMLLAMPDSARVALDAVPEQYAESRTVKQRRAELGG